MSGILTVTEILFQSSYQVFQSRCTSSIGILHIHSNTQVRHQSGNTIKCLIITISILGWHISPVIIMLKTCGKVLTIPGIGMRSNALCRIAMIFHHNSTRCSHTSRYIIIRSILVEWSPLVPFRCIQQFFSSKFGSCRSSICLIVFTQCSNLLLIALQQILQTLRQVVSIKRPR